MVSLPLIAVDVGNARIKLGLFSEPREGHFPEPTATLALDTQRPDWSLIDGWLRESAVLQAAWRVASVRRPTTARLLEYVRQGRPADSIELLEANRLPLRINVARPEAVGIDRLLDAVAANRLRRADRPAVVVDAGTAVTVDLVSATGAFLGGAILPGMAMAARAMHEFTDLLPLVETHAMDEPPSALGTDTQAAMRSGLFWGTFGAIEQLIGRLDEGGEAEVFLTGGTGATFARLLGSRAKHVPHLTLTGIALAADG